MPGIFGFTDRTHLESSHARDSEKPSLNHIGDIQDLLTHGGTYRRDKPFVDANIAASRTSVGIVNQASQPARYSGLRVWLEGEILNRSWMANKYLKQIDPSIANESDAHLIAALVSVDPNFRFLREFNGVFCGVVYDPTQSQLHFITDRHGLEFLYVVENTDSIAWSSEIKGFLADPNFRPIIDEQSLNEFMIQGHLGDDRTWFRNAKLIPPASHWVWNLTTRHFTEKKQYWSYDEWSSDRSPSDPREAAEESARLFRLAVASCDDRPQNRVGVLLSGGLDSRAIIAAMPVRDEPINAVTFGLPGSSDLAMAKRVASISGANHIFEPIDEQDWFQHREDFVWWLDGHLDFQHMHYATCAPQARQHFDVDLSGFLGDATIGGSYLNVNGMTETSRIVNRGRRFIGYGLQQGKIFSHERLPFFDNDFLSHAMRIPASLRRDSRFYFQMLRFLLPPKFHSIPWQATGMSIRVPPPLHALSSLVTKVNRRARKAVGFRSVNREFHDYHRWLASNSGRKLLSHYLLDTEAQYRSLSSFQRRSELAKVAAKSQFDERDVHFLSRGLTLECWLRQIDNPNLRPK